MTDDRPYRAGGLKMTRTVEGDGDEREEFVGEALVAELMATAVAHLMVEQDGGRTALVTALGFPRFAVDPIHWVETLRTTGWSVVVEGDSVTFAIVRG